MTTKPKILLVDDERAITANLTPFLERSGFVVAVAADGEAALAQVPGFAPDLIVLDILMPRLDGRETLRRLRQSGNWTPVILLTQVGESTERAMALEEGADDYLNKPFDPHELVARIRAVLRRARSGQPPLTSSRRFLQRLDHELKNPLERLLPLWVILVLVSSCTPATPPLPPTPTSIFTPTLTQTPTLAATSTPSPTLTPSPTPTSTPTPTPTPTPWPREGSTPERQGVDSGVLIGMFDYIEQQEADVHAVLVVRNGYTVLEVYYPPYGPHIRHGTASVGKSITGALVGIAIREGYIEGVDQKVADFFPERADLQDDPLKQAMTIEHLLTMTSGLDWPESAASYSSSANIMNQMMRSSDWVRFVLDRPMVAAPGTTFNYSSGTSHLLSAIIQEAAGERTLSFAKTYLFEPLGISRVSWPSDPHGIAFGAGGVRLTPRDMARFGQLYLQGGVWNGKQIVPADWVEASVARQVSAHGAASYYGYQWWVRGNGIYAAHGYRGKRIFVLPDLDMVVVFTADLSGNLPSVVLSNYIIPAARSSEPLPENPEGVARLEARISEIE